MNKLLFAAALAAFGARASCPPHGTSAGETPALPTVVATSFPHYDWARQIIGERTNAVDLVLLQQSGADLHSYQPTARDIRRIAASGLFIYVGGESDAGIGACPSGEGAAPVCMGHSPLGETAAPPGLLLAPLGKPSRQFARGFPHAGKSPCKSA